MDDIQIVLYIIFVLFAIVSRALKKKKQAPLKKVRQRQEPQEDQGSEKQLTFEELLREFTEEKQPEPKVETVKEEQYFDTRDDDEIKRVYEESIRASEAYQSKEHSDDRHTGNFQHFEHYSEEDLEEEESEIAKLLRDPESARNAIVLSEVLNKKY